MILASLWFALSAGHGTTAVATTALNVGVEQQEPPTSDLRRATRASYRSPLPPPPPPIPLGEKVVQIALSKVGSPYIWGNKGPNTFDCSGLVQWSWKQAGITLGPDTYAQFQQGVPVAPSDVQPGDLLFPSASMNSRGPGHVQLAIGNGMVIEAPGRGMTVRIVPMPTSFVARRVA